MNGTFNTDLSSWTTNAGWAYLNGTAADFDDAAANDVLSQTVTNLDKVQGNVVKLNLKLGAGDGSNAAGSTATLNILLNGLVWVT